MSPNQSKEMIMGRRREVKEIIESESTKFMKRKEMMKKKHSVR